MLTVFFRHVCSIHQVTNSDINLSGREYIDFLTSSYESRNRRDFISADSLLPITFDFYVASR